MRSLLAEMEPAALPARAAKRTPRAKPDERAPLPLYLSFPSVPLPERPPPSLPSLPDSFPGSPQQTRIGARRAS
jgi:hypothetical protein